MKYTKPTCFSYCSLFTCTRTQPPTHQIGHIHRSTLRRQNNLFITLDFNFYPRTAVPVSRRRIISTEGDTAVYTKINILIIFHTTGDGPINPPSTLPSTSSSIYESLKHGTDMHEISPKRRNTQQRNISTLTTSMYQMIVSVFPLIYCILLCFLSNFLCTSSREKIFTIMKTSIFDDAAIAASTPTFIGEDELVKPPAISRESIDSQAHVANKAVTVGKLK